MTDVVQLNSTLDQELLALMRGAALECPVCGEFVLHTGRAIACPECGASLRAAARHAGVGLQSGVQAG